VQVRARARPKEQAMGREHFVNRRAYHEDTGHEGVILDVHVDVLFFAAKKSPTGR
jgi:hypothetical protein